MPHSQEIENVLVLQGGGSLGAFGCGVYKALAKSGIRIDIVAGTSIGGINAAIIAGSKHEPPESELERFWMELAGSSVDLRVPTYRINSSNFAGSKDDFSTYYQRASTSLNHSLSFYSSAVYGNQLMFVPRWRPDRAASDPEYFRPDEWTYIYDHSPLAKTLEKYVDFNKLRPGGNANARLIITAVSVLTSEPLTFDSSRQEIAVRHLLGTSGYPLYGFPWTEVEKGVYAWDGSLLSNTPLREAIDAAPVKDKRVFIVENYPKIIERLPKNMAEVYHRARDIMFSDKTAHNIKMSKVITRYLQFIEDLYELVEKGVDFSKVDKQKLGEIRRRYQKINKQHGAEIKKIAYITRDEEYPYLYENTDFSPDGIKSLINEGESKTKQALKEMGF
jgi:NTE family protein